MAADSICLAVWSDPPVSVVLLVKCRIDSLGGMARQVDFKGFNLPLQLANVFLML